MRILAIDASLAGCSVALLADARILAGRRAVTDRGHAALLPSMVAAVLDEASMTAGSLDAIAATVGPGRFTGLRAALALAEGIAVAAKLPSLGVTTGEALVASLPADLQAERETWSIIDNRRGRVVLERFAPGAKTACGLARAMTFDELPPPPPRLILVGDAAKQVFALLPPTADVHLAEGTELPSASAVSCVAAWRLAGRIPPLSLAPLYIEAPAVRTPGTPGQREGSVGAIHDSVGARPAPMPKFADGSSASILASVHQAAFSKPEAWGPDTFRLMLELPGSFCLCSAETGFILARAIAGEAEILTLAVIPAARRQGIGSLLLAQAMAQACLQGASALFLEVAAGNDAAQALYTKAGFSQVGRRPRYYPDGGDALLLRRTLP